MVKVKIYFVNNEFHFYDEDPEIIQELKELQHLGYKGKELINKLFTDDWGAPPKFVKIIGNDSKGNPVKIQLNYE